MWKSITLAIIQIWFSIWSLSVDNYHELYIATDLSHDKFFETARNDPDVTPHWPWNLIDPNRNPLSWPRLRFRGVHTTGCNSFLMALVHVKKDKGGRLSRHRWKIRADGVTRRRRCFNVLSMRERDASEDFRIANFASFLLTYRS